jgi:hypothetical protein
MSDSVNGSADAPAEQPEADDSPKVAIIRNLIPDGAGGFRVIYNLSDGLYAGTIAFDAKTPQILALITKDFSEEVVPALVDQAKKMQEAAAAHRRQSPGGIALAHANDLSKIGRRKS